MKRCPDCSAFVRDDEIVQCKQCGFMGKPRTSNRTPTEVTL